MIIIIIIIITYSGCKLINRRYYMIESTKIPEPWKKGLFGTICSKILRKKQFQNPKKFQKLCAAGHSGNGLFEAFLNGVAVGGSGIVKNKVCVGCVLCVCFCQVVSWLGLLDC